MDGRVRYYIARLQPDLWENWVVTLVWGRKGSSKGRVKHQPVDDYRSGLLYLEKLARRRRQRGYQER